MPQLRDSRALIRQFCIDHHVSYAETGSVNSYATVLRHLNEVGATAAV